MASRNATITQTVECFPCKEDATGSIPVCGSNMKRKLNMLTVDDIRTLLPPNMWDYKPKSKSVGSFKQFPLADILNAQYNFKVLLYQFNKNTGVDTDSGDGYEKYLQVSDKAIQSLARSIVSYGDSNDTKMYKIEQWVMNNIEYKSDIANYKQLEYWAFPTLTLNKESGDCEDGAFLMHSLALAAGIPYDKLRTYGGFVQETEGSYQLGGHAWTAYRRESDDEWVEVDWCYYPTDMALDERQPMRDDLKYVDDFFYVDVLKTVDAILTNRIRKPTGYIGGLINTYV